MFDARSFCVMGRPPFGQVRGSEVSDVEDGISENSPSPLDFRTLFELESPYVLRTLRRLGVTERDVEDMTHEVFVAVHRELPKYNRARPIRPWLFAFCFRMRSPPPPEAPARNGAGHDGPGRRPGRRPGHPARPGEETTSRAPGAGRDQLDRRAVFVLHEIDGFTCEAIAQSLEIPLGTVYSRLRLAREEFTAKVRRLQAKRVLE